MVGCGAIGCELLKNFAMISLSSGKEGQLIITDPDHIETSNLSRQFLFREKHIRKPKSLTAAAVVQQMNPALKNHIIARLDRVNEESKHIYSHEFFEQLHAVTNALDNVQARLFIDQCCVHAKTPLLESGTLGPKGHLQVILPYLTESYSGQNDPAQEEGDIPHCKALLTLPPLFISHALPDPAPALLASIELATNNSEQQQTTTKNNKQQQTTTNSSKRQRTATNNNKQQQIFNELQCVTMRNND